MVGNFPLGFWSPSDGLLSAEAIHYRRIAFAFGASCGCWFVDSAVTWG